MDIISQEHYSLTKTAGVWEWNIETGELIWSDDIYRIFGFSVGEIQPDYKTFLSLIHDDDRVRVSTAIDAAVSSAQAYNLDFKVVRKNNDIRLVHAKGQLIDDDKKKHRMLGLCWDITKQYTTEQSLQKSNRALQMLSACHTLLLHAKNEDELIHGICRLITEYMEYRMAWVGYAEHNNEKSIRPVVHEGYEDGYLDEIKLSWGDNEYGQGPTGVAIRSGQVSVMQDIMDDPRYEQWRDAARQRDYQSSIALPLIYQQYTYGALNIYAYKANDFDKATVDLLQQLANDLAYGINNIRSHTDKHQLNKQLQQAQKMEAIGQLTGGIAHDFNNILASMLGFTNLALQRFVTKEQTELREYLQEVSQAGERARDLVSQLMTFSRTTDSQTMSLQPTPMVKEVVKMLHATIPTSIQLSYIIEPDIPPILISPVKFQQLLMNLCINARDAITEHGEINIQLKKTSIVESNILPETGQAQYTICHSCNKIIEAGDYVEIIVQDTGSGIKDSDLPHIFEPFYTTKNIDKGTGMGLSVMHGIVHQNNGHVRVDTQVGQGSVFRILLPVENDTALASQDNALSTSDTTTILNKARILVVDDEASVARFMGDLLSGYGGDVHIETSSQAALDLLTQQADKFDLLITDQAMPELMGTELVTKILKIKPDFKAILYTGYSEDIDEEKAIAMGIKAYMNKPIEIKKMIELIDNLLTEEDK